MVNRASIICGRILLALLAAFVFAVPTVLLAQAATKVVEVVIAGNNNINSDTIRNAVTLKAGDDYTEAAVEQDKAAIMAIGYFSAVTVQKEDVAGGVKLTYEVTENPKITDVKITGSDPLPASDISALMRTKSGQVLNVPSLTQDIERIQGYYNEKGYLAYLEEVAIDPQTGVLAVPVVVHRIESVEITGNKKTKSVVVLREMKTKPGTFYNINTLKDDYRKIANLDIFEEVKNPEMVPGSDVGLLKIVIGVVEKKTGQVSFGAGYSSRQRLVGQMKLSETNFRGMGQGLNLMWEQGTVNSTGGNASYELGFFEPWIDRHNTSLSVSAFNKLVYRFSSGLFGQSGTLDNDQLYNERHKGGDITVSRPLNEQLRVYVGGRFANVDADPSLLTVPSPTTPGLLNASDLVNIIQMGNVTAGSLRFVHNTRDLDKNPSSGGYEAISFQLGTVDATRYMPVTQFVTNPNDPTGPLVEQTVATPFPFNGGFQKTQFDLRRYYSRLGRKALPNDKRRPTVALRVLAGFGNGSIPYSEQFFVGGSETLRGYREDRFWGNKMLLASAEYRKPITDALTGVLFVDYGDAWGSEAVFNVSELPQHNSFEGFFGTGLGIRVVTPVGNLRLDYAIGNDGPRSHFSVGHAF